MEEDSGGRGERDEQSPWSVYLQCCCFCSELTLMDTHIHTHIQRGKHPLTYTIGSLWVRYSSVDPPCITSLSSSAADCLSGFSAVPV